MNLGNKGYWNCLTRSHLFHSAFEVRVVDFCAQDPTDICCNITPPSLEYSNSLLEVSHI